MVRYIHGIGTEVRIALQRDHWVAQQQRFGSNLMGNGFEHYNYKHKRWSEWNTGTPKSSPAAVTRPQTTTTVSR
jgi:hypothetical protein